MKIFITISVSMLLIVGTMSFVSPTEIKSVTTFVVDNNQVIVKAPRKYKGADVEVVSSTGETVTFLKLNKRKMIIDFKNVRSGSYVIKIKKEATKEEFQFIK